ncbi:MAG: PAS sensor protein [Bacteroidales bacterium]|nr:PAS sensor protein [Bacteroidales bacterium]
MPDWAKEMNCAVTVCDKDGIILYMNDKAKETFAKHGDLIGKSLIPCHNDRSRAIIADLLATGGSNAYTIQKNGQKKMIYQSAWRENGEVAGLVEISMVIPEEMPHYVR